MAHTDDSKPDLLLERIIAHLREQEVPDFPDAEVPVSEEPPVPQASESPSSLVWRLVMNRRWQLSATAVLALMATGLVCILAPGTAGTSWAFGEVKKAVGQSRSVTYTLTTTGWENDPWPDPYMRKVMVLEPGRSRSETNTGEVTVFNLNEGRFLRVLHKERKAEVYPLYPQSEDLERRWGDFHQHLRNISATATKKIGEKKIDGRNVVEFLWKHNRADCVVTVDAATKLPVRMEVSRGKVHHDKEIRDVFSDFVFDADLNESLFSTAVPEGYEVEDRVPDPSS
ncbi:MAG: hypothetical protein ACYTG0_35700, partial [Planctomycetota bacterium]